MHKIRLFKKRQDLEVSYESGTEDQQRRSTNKYKKYSPRKQRQLKYHQSTEQFDHTCLSLEDYLGSSGEDE